MATNTSIANKSHTHAVVYLGAPYGDREGGHIVSLHKSYGAARNAKQRMGELKGREHTIVELDDTKAGPRWVFSDVKTPRDYFLLG